MEPIEVIPPLWRSFCWQGRKNDILYEYEYCVQSLFTRDGDAMLTAQWASFTHFTGRAWPVPTRLHRLEWNTATQVVSVALEARLAPGYIRVFLGGSHVGTLVQVPLAQHVVFLFRSWADLDKFRASTLTAPRPQLKPV